MSREEEDSEEGEEMDGGSEKERKAAEKGSSCSKLNQGIGVCAEFPSHPLCQFLGVFRADDIRLTKG